MELSAKDYVKVVQSERAKLIVGQGTEQEIFNIPKDLLAIRSKHFATGFSEKWGEPSKGVAFSDHTVPAFRIFTYWLYKDELPDTDPDKSSRSLLRQWIDAWFLFDYLTIPKQQNMVMRKMCDIVWNNSHNGNLMTDDDVAHMLAKGRTQLRIFASEALVMNIGQGGAEWTDFEAIHGDIEFVAELWSKHLRPEIKVNVFAGMFRRRLVIGAQGRFSSRLSWQSRKFEAAHCALNATREEAWKE